MKTGFEAAQHYFMDSLTDAYRRRDPHGWNRSQGLALLAKSLKEMDERLGRVEKQIAALCEGQQRQK
ncbi:MAG: hypothetical protein ABSC77_08960 [Terracidiphilus sp.]|jgi:hypothetical protein